VSETAAFALDIGIILSGVPVYYIWRRFARRAQPVA